MYVISGVLQGDLMQYNYYALSLQAIIMKTSCLIFGLLCLALAPCLIEAGPLAEEKENGEVVEW